MESTSGPVISPLLRPRIIAAVIISATAALSIGAGIWYQSWQQIQPPAESSPPAGGLHRRNAIRRARRSSFLEVNVTSDDGGEPVANAPPTDENTVDPLNSDGRGISQREDREVTIVEESEDDPWLDDAPSSDSLRVGHNIVNLLFRVSEDNARRSAYVHRGCACNACGVVPIRGIRYRCANCADFDLCETCESQGLHIKTHIFYKVKVPAPPFGPRQMQPVWYTGNPDEYLRSLPKSLMARLSRETGFERQELEAFWEQWTYMANTEWRDDPDGLCLAMDRKTFERCLVPSGGYRHAAPNLIHDRMFAFYDTNNDELISFHEFLHGLSYRKRKDKLRKIFEGYDMDRDGLVNRRDFLRFFRAYYVLYKQMHRDILEGLDDQIMSSTETHQLVTHRQPISSFFGREGRLPRADTNRMMGGKYIDHVIGEVRVAEGVDGVVAEDRPVTADREDLLALLHTRSRFRVDSESIIEERIYASGDESGDEHDDGVAVANYWYALLSQRQRVQGLTGLLPGQRDPLGVDDDVWVPEAHSDYDVQEFDASLAEQLMAAPTGGNDISDATNAANADAPESEASFTPGSSYVFGRGNGLSYLDASTPEQREVITNTPRARGNLFRAPTEGQLAARKGAFVQAHLSRASRIAARRKLYNRWMRRQFYLDEEEGAKAPAGWTDDKDILGSATEGGKAAKVGGSSSPSKKTGNSLAEIPASERDAGREVLYQVMQEAFNELLDILFQEKESLAIEAAETRRRRDKFRHLYDNLDVTEAGRQRSRGDKSKDNRAKAKAAASDKPLADMTLPEMLAHAGYEVIDDVLRDEADAKPESGTDSVANAAAETAAVEKSVSQENTAQNTATADEQLGDACGAGSTEESPSSRNLPIVDGSAAASIGKSLRSDRDPTMPQFRANSESEHQAMQQAGFAAPTEMTAAVVANDVEIEAGEREPEEQDLDGGPSIASRDKGKGKADIGVSSGDVSTDGPADNDTSADDGDVSEPDHDTLLRWKQLDLAEREAKTRGGWGKLNYDEFEAIFKQEELSSNRLDYLGSWIDFCIP
ncbi:hypothetical protein SEPCBS119000_003044 [Sporothrix epigloea]|uniref:Uncharacterized protein n=1 Tax=Sporothrix epigloea TaxID=1892477 RepID=A0ABP0DJF8_9PEZI